MSGRLLLATTLLLAIAAPAAGTPVTEVTLPDDARQPATLAFAEDGHLWLTLDGSWALARVDPDAPEDVDLVPLATPRADENDALWALSFGPDGSVWTASRTHAHRVDAATLEATAYPMPVETLLSGDVHVTDAGVVWVALVTADAFARLDPTTGDVTVHPVPAPENRDAAGPLLFAPGPAGLYFTATYGGTYGHLDADTGESTTGPGQILAAPTGILQSGDGRHLWIAEHGASTLARVDPETGAVERYPSTPSPYYPMSGPTGLIEARDGSLWMAHHFADRIARFDPAAGTLHAFEVPSAPGANIQRVAEGPDGRVWFAAWSADRIGYVTFDDTTAPPAVPERVTVARGETTRFAVDAPDARQVVPGSDEQALTVRYEDGHVVVDAADAPAGDHLIVVSVEDGPVRAGRYVTVSVTEPASTPGVPVTATLTLLAVLTILTRRRA